MNPFLAPATFVLAPVLTGVALILLAAAKWLGMMPKGLSASVALGIAVSLSYTFIYAADWVDTCCIQPVALQHELFGRTIATPFDLREVDRFGFQDVGIDRFYAIDPVELNALRQHCQLDRPFPGRCFLADKIDDSMLHSAEVQDDGLIIRDWDS